MVYFTECLVKTEKFVSSHNIKGLLIHMSLPNYDHSDCRLFIYNSKRSLKCILLHNSKEYASVWMRKGWIWQWIWHSVQIKEKYQEIKTPGIKYNNHKWICDDLKIIKFQLGQ